MPVLSVIILAICIILVAFLQRTADLLKAAVILAIMNVFVGLYFYLMSAPDLAITQLAVNAGISTALFVYVIKKCGERYE